MLERPSWIKWTDEQLTAAVATSASWSQVSRALGLRSVSGSIRTLPKHARRLGLDVAGIVGRQASGNRTRARYNKYPLDKLLVEHSTYTSTGALKKRLFDEGLLKDECSICGALPVWQGRPLCLQLDHKNGVRSDNRLENLRVLCPNCHSQTDTYAGKNAGKNKVR